MPIEVHIVTRPTFDAHVYKAALGVLGPGWKQTPGASNSEEIVEAAGRICYLSYGEAQAPRTNAEYIANLIGMGHESVLEHVNWGFVLTGISRAFSHQLVRHRVGWAFSQLSQQYHDELDAQFAEPSALSRSPAARIAWNEAVEASRDAYRKILRILNESASSLSSKEEKEIRRGIFTAARSVLPNATETKIFATVNARALRHFFSLRGAIEGDEEMRRVSALLLAIVREDAPALFSDFAIESLQDGSPRVVRRME